MNIVFQGYFEANFRAKLVDTPSRPGRIFCYPGAFEGGFVEGVKIEFFPENQSPWFGSFASGNISQNAASYAGNTPCPNRALVVAKGEGYLIEPASPRNWTEVPLRPVMGILCLPKNKALIIWDFVRMACIDGKGIRWRTPSISWDGI